MTEDYCPARVEPHPPGVPLYRQLRAVRLGDAWEVLWLDSGGGACRLTVPAGWVNVRQAGCRCTANPRLLELETVPPPTHGTAPAP